MQENPHAVTTPDYWVHRWGVGNTGWRREREQNPFHRNVAAAITKRLGAACSDEADVRAAITGARVFVPLCGDSPVLRYLFDAGCSVTGVEFHKPAAAAAVADLFPELTFTESPLPAANAPHACEFVATAPATAAFPERTVRLVSGDFFATCTAVLEPASFDLCYDRGSFVAVAESQREEYGAAISRVMRRGPSDAAPQCLRLGAMTVLVAAEYYETPGGPPFTCTKADIAVYAPGVDVGPVVLFGEEDSAATKKDGMAFYEVVYAFVWQ